MYDYKSLVPSSLERVSDCPITLSVISWPRLLTELINSSCSQFLLDNEAGPSQSRADPNGLKSDQDSHRNQLLIARHCHNCLCLLSRQRRNKVKISHYTQSGNMSRHAGYADCVQGEQPALDTHHFQCLRFIKPCWNKFTKSGNSGN